MDDSKTEARIEFTVEKIETPEETPNTESHLKQLWAIQEEYEKKMGEIFSEAAKESSLPADEAEDYTLATIAENPQTAKRLEAAENETKHKIEQMKWKDKGEMLAARNNFMKQFHQKHPDPHKRPVCTIHLLEEIT